MNIFAKVLAQLPLIPGIVKGIQALITETGQGATKKQLAMDSLGLGVAITETALPQFAPEIEAAKALASGTIDLVVAGFNKAGWTGHGVSAITVAQPTPTKQLRRIG